MAIVTGVATVVPGCSYGARNGAPTSSSPPQSGMADGAGSAPAGAIGVSAGGVTTRVDVPAHSTEEEYYQACHAAKVWIDAQPKTGASLFEPYLAMVQASPSGTPGHLEHPLVDVDPGPAGGRDRRRARGRQRRLRVAPRAGIFPAA